MKVLISVIGGIGLLLAMMTIQSCSSTQAGPNGGDVVTLNKGKAKAEIVANTDTGEVMVHTWDQSRQEFDWNNCWMGGKTNGSMWKEMGEHRRGMMEHGPGGGMGQQ